MSVLTKNLFLIVIVFLMSNTYGKDKFRIIFNIPVQNIISKDLCLKQDTLYFNNNGNLEKLNIAHVNQIEVLPENSSGIPMLVLGMTLGASYALYMIANNPCDESDGGCAYRGYAYFFGVPGLAFAVGGILGIVGDISDFRFDLYDNKEWNDDYQMDCLNYPNLMNLKKGAVQSLNSFSNNPKGIEEDEVISNNVDLESHMNRLKVENDSIISNFPSYVNFGINTELDFQSINIETQWLHIKNSYAPNLSNKVYQWLRGFYLGYVEHNVKQPYGAGFIENIFRFGALIGVEGKHNEDFSYGYLFGLGGRYSLTENYKKRYEENSIETNFMHYSEVSLRPYISWNINSQSRLGIAYQLSLFNALHEHEFFHNSINGFYWF
jgi:hypothetical protein